MPVEWITKPRNQSPVNKPDFSRREGTFDDEATVARKRIPGN